MKSLSNEDYSRLLNALRNKRDTISLCLELAMITGARQSEVIGLKFDAVDFDSRVIRIRSLKGSKDRVIPLPAETLLRIRSIMPVDALNFGHAAYPFVSPQNRSRMLRRAWESLQRDVLGCKRVKLHGTRHTFGIRVMRHFLELKDPDALRKTQSVMGHKNIQNTLVYLDQIQSENLGPSVLEAMRA